MKPDITGAITGPNNGTKEYPANAAFRDWASNISEMTPAHTFMGTQPNKPPMNRQTIICAVVCENAHPRLKNNDIQHDTSRTNLRPI